MNLVSLYTSEHFTNLPLIISLIYRSSLRSKLDNHYESYFLDMHISTSNKSSNLIRVYSFYGAKLGNVEYF